MKGTDYVSSVKTFALAPVHMAGDPVAVILTFVTPLLVWVLSGVLI